MQVDHQCDNCGGNISPGEPIFRHRGSILCSTGCLGDFKTAESSRLAQEVIRKVANGELMPISEFSSLHGLADVL